jgi:hypothetical protein
MNPFHFFAPCLRISIHILDYKPCLKYTVAQTNCQNNAQVEEEPNYGVDRQIKSQKAK